MDTAQLMLLTSLAVSALTGVAIPFLVSAVTHAQAPVALKSGLAFALSALSGVLTTVVWASGERWQDYVLAIVSAWALAIVTHYSGATEPVKQRTANVGVGRRT
ncbi:MAG: hypothetical protein ACRDMV_25085 [Streptosporangiales bacterium]